MNYQTMQQNTEAAEHDQEEDNRQRSGEASLLWFALVLSAQLLLLIK